MDNSQNTVTSRLWTFEGGNPATSVDANPVVTYSTPGTYSVTLEVSNSVGTDSEIIMNAVTVLDLPSASFTMSQAANIITYTYTGNPNDDILWTLPDGSTSMETVVNYTVTENGNYEATLSVNNLCGGDSEMISTSINAYPDARCLLMFALPDLPSAAFPGPSWSRMDPGRSSGMCIPHVGAPACARVGCSQ